MSVEKKDSLQDNSIQLRTLQTNATYEDKSLFLLISEGSESAFRQLFHKYVPLFLPVVTGIVGHEGAANDIIQEIFLKVWLSRDKLAEIDIPRSWMFKIMYHQCYSVIRNRKVREKASAHLSISGDQVAYNDGEDVVSLEETGKLIKTAVEALAPQSQKIYLMSRSEELKIPEIAAQLGLSVQTVKNTLHRALKQIRQHLEKHGVDLPLVFIWFWLD